MYNSYYLLPFYRTLKGKKVKYMSVLVKGSILNQYMNISQPKEDTSNLAAIDESTIERYFVESLGIKTFYLIIKK